MDAVRTSLMVPHLWQLVDAFEDEDLNGPPMIQDLDGFGEEDENLDYVSANAMETW